MFEIENFLIVVAVALALSAFTHRRLGTVRDSRHLQFGQRNGGINACADLAGPLREEGRAIVPWLIPKSACRRATASKALSEARKLD